MATKPKYFTVRAYESDDYPTVKKWWEAHGMPVLPENILPSPGIICELKGEMVGVTWLYLSNSNAVALRAWTTVNPVLSPQDVYQVVCHLNDYSEIEAQENSYSAVLTITGNKGLAKINRRTGFTDMEPGIIQLKAI